MSGVSVLPSRRFGYIDAIRGVAAVSVVVQHASEFIIQAHPKSVLVAGALNFILFHGINLGRFGVLLFFMISGFVIPFSFSGRHPIKKFVTSRIFRLYPAYWLSILLILGSFYIVGGPFFSIKAIVLNFTMIQRVFGVDSLMQGYWTLFIEIIFYGITAILYWRGWLSRSVVLFSLTTLFVSITIFSSCIKAVLRSRHHIPAPDEPMMLGYMFVGALARRAFHDQDALARRLIWPALIGLALSSPIIGGVLFPVTANGNVYFAPVTLMISYLLPIPLFAVAVITRSPDTRWMRYLGSCSYSIYLMQGVTLTLLAKYLPPGPNFMGELVYLATVLGSTLLISSVTYKFVEKPFIGFGRALERRLNFI